MRSPSTSRAACSMGRAPVPSRRRAAVISVKRRGVSVMRSPPDGWWRNAAPTVAQAGRQWPAPSRVAENAEPGAGRRRSTTAALAPGPIRLLAARRLQELERCHAELIRGAGRDPEVEVASASRRDDVADSLDHVSDGLQSSEMVGEALTEGQRAIIGTGSAEQSGSPSGSPRLRL